MLVWFEKVKHYHDKDISKASGDFPTSSNTDPVISRAVMLLGLLLRAFLHSFSALV